jgi:hypothetical protein
MSGSAQQSVADRVGQTVGIAVAFKAVVCLEANAAQDERAPGNEAVYVVAVADSHDAGVCCREVAAGTGQWEGKR